MSIALQQVEPTSPSSRLPNGKRLLGKSIWLLQVAVILLMLTWLAMDGYLDGVRLVIRPTVVSEQLPTTITTPRVLGLWTLCGLFCVAWWTAIIGTLMGHWKQFGIKPLFFATFTMAAWLAMLANWTSIVDAGRQWRLQSELKQLKAFAAQLDSHWADIIHDGDSFRIPQFNAYPISSPTLLLFLGSHKVPGTSVEYCAIERSEPNVIRIELTGSNTHWWIEVRPDGARPTQFIGGLNERFSQRKARQLGDHIYLVQYTVDEL